MAFPAPTKTFHNDTYDTINPLNPELSQEGKNIVLTGAGTGIGQAIALSFARAKATNLAIIGRTRKTLEETKTLIEATGSPTKVHIYIADIANESALNTAFASYASTISGPIHTLVANAGLHPGGGLLASVPTELSATSLITNGVGTLNTLRAVLPHISPKPDSSGYRARIIHTSTAAIHLDMPANNPYAIGKLAAARFVQAFAAEHPDIWLTNFRPGIIDTAMATKAAETGVKLQAQDTLTLPADWTVWAASRASEFVGSGRFLWAHWDVTELREVFAKIERGELDDGAIIMGALPAGQRFKIGIKGFP